MPFHLRGTRRGLLAALTACALTAALLGGTAQSASAFVPCPSGETPAGGIDEWETDFPREYDRAGGVTLCEASGGFLGADTMGYLQIVDLNDGARIRLVATADPRSPEHGRFETETLFTKRTAEEWYEWITSLNPWEEEFNYHNYDLTFPAQRQLFSVTNAGFFSRTENGVPTEVPFPLWTARGDDSMGVSFNRGIGDFDYEAPKVGLMIGSPIEPETQDVEIETFPTNYEYYLLEYLGHVGGEPYINTWDAMVSFTPEVVVGEAGEEYKNRRNYLGIYDNIVYIFTSDNRYTNDETVRIMEEIQPNMEMIQLDGGGSAQFYTRENGAMDSSIPNVPPIYENRQVASVLAVYRAAE
jgi:hypothetical protein